MTSFHITLFSTLNIFLAPFFSFGSPINYDIAMRDAVPFSLSVSVCEWERGRKGESTMPNIPLHWKFICLDDKFWHKRKYDNLSSTIYSNDWLFLSFIVNKESALYGCQNSFACVKIVYAVWWCYCYLFANFFTFQWFVCVCDFVFVVFSELFIYLCSR